MLEIKYSKDALKFYRSIPSKQQGQIARRIEHLREEPFGPGTIKLKGKPCRRARCGEFRIAYNVEDDVLDIIAIDNRNDGELYKIVNRLLSALWNTV